MYKRYQGNSGKVVWVEDTPRPSPPPQPQDPARRPPPGGAAQRRPAPRPPVGLRLTEMDLETEDLLLLLILYLLYRESGDSELLMIIGAMFLL